MNPKGLQGIARVWLIMMEHVAATSSRQIETDVSMNETETSPVLLSLDEEEEGAPYGYNAEAHNPLRHSFVESGCLDILTLADRFPTYLDRTRMEDLVVAHLEDTVVLLLKTEPTQEEARMWGRRLRGKALVELERQCRDCTGCDLAGTGPRNCIGELNPTPVFGEGALDPLVMFVGEAPGHLESRTGIPMVGSVELRGSHCAHQCTHFEACFVDGRNFVHHVSRPCNFEQLQERKQFIPLRLTKRNPLNTAGELLDSALGESGLIRSSPQHLVNLLRQWGKGNPPDMPEANVYITNAVRHHPTDSEGKNRRPTVAEIKGCGPWLEMTVHLVRPKVVVALGGPGLSALGISKDIKSITALCSSNPKEPVVPLKTRLHPVVFPCIHPSYAMRQKQDFPESTWEAKIVAVLTQARKYAESLVG